MADDVAEDYRQALEDLSINSRLEISTLTNIARENADHGHAIAEVLQTHIKKVPPPRTLPALYVLDSIVKNVPTPYALYFGPKLYSIFMDAYAKVDNPTRRKMDEMLKTWKEPVPGSISTRPVFPPEYVRPIENALIGARNATFAAQQRSFQGQQQLLRRGPPTVPARETPTPPNARPPSHFAPPPFPGPNGQIAQDANYPIRPPSATGQLPPTTAGLPYHLPHQPVPREVYGTSRPDINIDKLRDDIQHLIVVERAEFVRDPHDASKQTRLRALLELQTLIQRPDVPRDQLMLVKDKVSELAVNTRVPVPSTGPPPLVHQYPAATAPYTSTPTPPVVLSHQPTSTHVPPVAAPRPPSVTLPGGQPPAAPALSIDNLFGQGALATLLGGIKKPVTTAAPPSASSTPQPLPVPLPVPAVVPARPIPPQITTPVQAEPSKPPAADPSALLAMLRQSGLLGATTNNNTTPTPPPATAPPAPAPASGISLASLGLAGLPGLLPKLAPAANSTPTPTPTYLPNIHNRPPPPPLNPLSFHLKRFNNRLLSRLHDDLGAPCGQCGRRFPADEAGRRKKTAHMDWHFRVHQRIAEAEKRGQHRSWYVGEMDWIRGREAVDVDYVAPEGGEGAERMDGEGGEVREKAKKEYIAVPDDSSRVNSICPICQERFEMKWLDEAQEWVWMDAVKIGERVFHASCHREATEGGSGNGNGIVGRATPEGVLGKRKAEDEFSPVMRGKLKLESGY